MRTKFNCVFVYCFARFFLFLHFYLYQIVYKMSEHGLRRYTSLFLHFEMFIFVSVFKTINLWPFKVVSSSIFISFQSSSSVAFFKKKKSLFESLSRLYFFYYLLHLNQQFFLFFIFNSMNATTKPFKNNPRTRNLMMGLIFYYFVLKRKKITVMNKITVVSVNIIHS